MVEYDQRQVKLMVKEGVEMHGLVVTTKVRSTRHCFTHFRLVFGFDGKFGSLAAHHLEVSGANMVDAFRLSFSHASCKTRSGPAEDVPSSLTLRPRVCRECS